MKIIAFLISCLGSFYTIAQPLQTAWVQSIPGDSYEQSSSMSIAPCGDIYTVGFFQGDWGGFSSVGNEDGFIAKYNDQGQLLWLKQLAGTNVDRVNAVVVAGDNEIYVAGEFAGTYYYNNDSLVSQHKLDAFMLKIDSAGVVQWAIQGGGFNSESVGALELLDNGKIGVVGYYDDDLTFGGGTLNTLGSRDVFVAVFDGMGNLQWMRGIGGPGIDEGRSLASDDSNNIYVTGAFRDFLFVGPDTLVGEGVDDVYLAKYDVTGQLQWVKTMGGDGYDKGMDVNIDRHQDVYVVGWYDRFINIGSQTVTGHEEEDGFLMKFDGQGNLIWVNSLAWKFDERIYGVDFDAGNHVYVMGTLDSFLILGTDTLTNRHLNRPTDIFIAKYSLAGSYRWAQTLGHYYNDFCYDFWVKDAGTVYVTGSFQDTSIFVNDTLFSQVGYDVFLGKFDMDSTVSIRRIENGVHNDLRSVNFYPNPCSGQGYLTYTLENASALQIYWCDVLGRKTVLLNEKNQPAGTYTINVEALQRSGGIGFLQLKTPTTVYTITVRFE